MDCIEIRFSTFSPLMSTIIIDTIITSGANTSFCCWHFVIVSETETLHRVATKEREETKGTTKQKMARRLNREGGNHLD